MSSWVVIWGAKVNVEVKSGQWGYEITDRKYEISIS